MEGNSIISDNVPAFAWRDCEKSRKPIVMIASLRAEIWIRNIQNTKQEY
jgi:hypothetical protein